MPNSQTFDMGPVSRLLDRWLTHGLTIVDPFARNSTRGTETNDLDPSTDAKYHLHAEEFVNSLCLWKEKHGFMADAVLFDPPYSPRQITEMYKRVGLKVGIEETQNARLYKTVKDGLDKILRPKGIAICFGWNSMGFGITRGYEMLEVLLVTHGGAHNDTIVTVERKHSKECVCRAGLFESHEPGCLFNMP